MCKIVNYRFEGYIGDIKGFCIFEPVIRIRQLLSFPIEQFADIKVTDILLPEAPNSLSGDGNKDIYLHILELRSYVEQWEHYYIDVCKSIEKLITKTL